MTAASLTTAYNLGWGYRYPNQKWPTVEAMMLDVDGDGQTEFVGPSLQGKTFAYDQPGVYFPTAVVTDADGFRFTVRSLVRVTT